MKKLLLVALIIPLLSLSSCIWRFSIFENLWMNNPDLKNFTYRETILYPELDTILDVDGYYFGKKRDSSAMLVLLYRDGTIARMGFFFT